jgi:hypothetical protein
MAVIFSAVSITARLWQTQVGTEVERRYGGCSYLQATQGGAEAADAHAVVHDVDATDAGGRDSQDHVCDGMRGEVVWVS